MGSGEQDALGGKLVEPWARNVPVAVRAQLAPQVVPVHDQHVVHRCLSPFHARGGDDTGHRFSETNSDSGRAKAQPSNSSAGRSGKSGTGPRHRMATGSASAGIASRSPNPRGSNSDTQPHPQPPERTPT